MVKQYYKMEGYQAQRAIGYLLRRAGKLITAQVAELFAQQDVSFVQWVILMLLRDGLATTAAELCQHICHDSGALTRVIDQLEQHGLVRRRRSKHDRRMVTLELTMIGRKTTEMFLPRVIELYNLLLSDFTPEEADKLIDLLRRLTLKLTSTKEL